ncbi:MAG: hypothetical protein Q8Q39_02520 [bacterium]|nr:hypothetical protein [bacterium]
MDVHDIAFRMRALSEDAIGEFRPFAIYNNRLDHILVQTKDCSMTEVRINGCLTLLEDNYSQEGEANLVGFLIEGASRLCAKYRIRTDPAKLLEIFGALLKESPDVASHVFRLIALLDYGRDRLDTVEIR